jgi:hypothetical protein
MPDVSGPVDRECLKREAAAIRAAYEQGGELAAAVELRRLFPGLANNENTRICARTIVGWKPIPGQGCAGDDVSIQIRFAGLSDPTPIPRRG